MALDFFKKNKNKNKKEEKDESKLLENTKMIESLAYSEEELSKLCLIEENGVFVPSAELMQETMNIAEKAELSLSEAELLLAAKAYGVFCDIERLKRIGLIDSYGVENPLDLTSKFVVYPNKSREVEFNAEFQKLVERGQKNRSKEAI